MNQLDEKAIERIRGPSWEKVRPSFMKINEALLSVSPVAYGELTTIYVKYTTSPSRSEVYAVVWIKSSKQILVGLSLPDNTQDVGLCDAFPGTTYKGLTKYFKLLPEDAVPLQMIDWAKAAYENVVEGRNLRPNE